MANIFKTTDTGNIVELLRQFALALRQFFATKSDIPTSLPANGGNADYATSAGTAETASSVEWDNVANKPDSFKPSSHTHTTSEITDFPESLPASDVYDWAKAETKPSYSWSEIDSRPTNVSDFTNDAGYITDSDAKFGKYLPLSGGTVTGQLYLTGLEEGNLDVTDNTELLTSYASNNGFSETNDTGKVYRRDAIRVYNYIKGKLDSVYSKIGHKHTTSEIDGFPTSLPANGGNADTVDNKHASDFAKAEHTHSYLPLSGGTMTLGEGLKFHDDDNYFGTHADARIISLLDSNDVICDGGLIIDERATLNGVEHTTELLRIRHEQFLWKGNTIWHAGNDGSGSGLDADTLDGNHASAFAAAGHTHDYLPFYQLSSADCNTMSQGLTAVRAVSSNQNALNHSAFLTITDIGTPFQLQIPDADAAYIYKRSRSGSSWSSWAKLSAGYADSAGNADTVDNEHASAFAHIGAHNNLTASGNEFTFASSGFSGIIWFNYRTAGGANGNITGYYFGNGAGGLLGLAIHSGNYSSYALPLSGGTLRNDNMHSTLSLNATNGSADAWNKEGNTMLRFVSNNNAMVFSIGSPINERTGFIQVGHADADNYAFVTSSLHLNKLGGTVYINDNVAWHAGNDGSGSGLDADLLDGYHASDFATAGHTHSYLPFEQSVKGVDMNTVKTTGFYYGYNMTNSAASAISSFIVAKYSDDWGSQIQLCSGNSRAYIRYWQNAGGVMDNWKELAYTSDIPSSLPANGGNADTVDNLHASYFSYNMGSDSYNCNDLPHGTHSATYRFNSSPINAFPEAAYGNMLVIGAGSDTMTQLGAPYNKDELYFRRGTWGSDGGTIRTNTWKTILHSGNYNSYAPTLTGTGATGTWDINIKGNADTVDNMHASDFATAGHTHDYLPFYQLSSADCNTMSQGLTAVRAVSSNQNALNHSAFLTITDIGTPFQLQIPDADAAYIYKRSRSGSSWSSWAKLSAGYADSAGNADTLDGKHASEFMLKSDHAGDMYEADDAYSEYCRVKKVWQIDANPSSVGTFADELEVPVPSADVMNKLADCIKQTIDITLHVGETIIKSTYTWSQMHWLKQCSRKDCIVYTTKYAIIDSKFPSVKDSGGTTRMPPTTIEISVSFDQTTKTRYVQAAIENVYGRAYYTLKK